MPMRHVYKHAHLTCVCTHTLPSPGQRAGLGQSAVDRGGHCSLWVPAPAVFLAGGPGEPQDSSGSTDLALEPSTCSHAFAIVRRCEGPPDAWPSSLPQRGPPGATFPHAGHPRFCSSSHSSRHGPTSPVSFLVVSLCSRSTRLLCGKQTRKQTRQQLMGRGRRWGQFRLRGPV